MATLLLLCDGTPNALRAVTHAIAAHHGGEVRMVHLLNVQPPFPDHVARHVEAELCAEFHRERAEEALAQAKEMLSEAGVPWRAHAAVGDKVDCINDAARRLACDRILVGTSRKSALLRVVENSLTGRLLEQAVVPVEVIGGAPAGALERVGIPAGVGAGVALLWMGAS